MPRPLVVSISHSLGKEEALRRLKSGMARATVNVPVLRLDEEHWTGDRLMFRVSALGQVASGSVDVGDDTVRLEVTLPWMLQKFAEVVQAAVRARGRILLAKK